MSAIGDRIKGWCQEESLGLVSERDDEAGLVYVIALADQPALSVTIRGSRPEPDPVLVTHTFEMSIPDEMQRVAEGQEQVAALLERAAASRSGLIDCRPTQAEGKPAAEVSVTLHGDGLTKQCFLSALEDIRKMRRVVGWGLEGISQLASGLVDARAAMEDTEALAAEVAQAAEVVQEAAAAPEAEAPSPEPTPEPAEVAPSSPSAAVPGVTTPTGRFCPNCGKQAKSDQRFCIGCGTSLETQR
jgi:hypothetical protein